MIEETSAAGVSQVHRLQRELEFSSLLLNAISTDDPVAALAAQLSQLCRGSAIVYDADGVIVASAGQAPTQLIWNQISATNVANLEFPLGRWIVRTRTVGLHDGVHVLAIASLNEKMIEELGELLLDISERMLSAVNGIQHGASLRDRRDNEHLIAVLQDGVLPSREHRYWSRLAKFKFSSYLPLRAIDAASPDPAEVLGESSVRELIEFARKDAVPLLITVRKLDQDVAPTINALVPANRQADRWMTKISKQLILGVSAPFSALAETPAAFREAEIALGIARARTPFVDSSSSIGARLVVKLDEVDVTTWALSHVDNRQLVKRVDAVLHQFDDAAMLRETLVNYLALDQQIGATADAMFVHPNTVRYRLSKIEELYGEPIGSAAFVANLYFCLQDEVLVRKHALTASSELSA